MNLIDDEYVFQEITELEMPLLEDMLYNAIFIGDAEPIPRDIIYEPNIFKYINKWDSNNDIGYMVVDKKTNKKLGAVWIRTFSKNNKGYGYINENIPELSIAMYPEYRGKGLGTALIKHLISKLPPQINSISLSVDIQNPAKKLYEKVGFKDYVIDDGTAIMIYEKERKKSG